MAGFSLSFTALSPSAEEEGEKEQSTEELPIISMLEPCSTSQASNQALSRFDSYTQDSWSGDSVYYATAGGRARGSSGRDRDSINGRIGHISAVQSWPRYRA